MLRVILAITVLCVNAFTSHAVADSSSWNIKRILIVHSYEPSYQWTADLQKGIDNAFSHSNTPVKLSIEYLDTKRINSPDYYQSLTDYFTQKYTGYKFDGVIATDDNAVKFLNTFRFKTNRNTPIVAVGINDTSANLYNITDKATMLYERDNITENIKLINKLRPNLKNLYYLADYSVTSELIRNEVIQTLSEFPNINLVELRDQSLEEASSILSKVSSDDAVLLTHFNTQLEQSIYHSYQEVAHEISAYSAAPVFSLWKFYIQGEVLGGYVNYSESMGKEAVIALNNYVPLNLPETYKAGSNKRVVFDYKVMDRFDINKRILPRDTVYLNEPTSFIKENYRLLIAVGIVFVGLVTIILMQFITLRQKKELAKKSKKILALQKSTLNVQKEMIHLLGEAIETRSGETGNHVKRVAKLSALLARLQGLSHREVEMIEIISPMHDVGKISVPEAVLDKPGKLTAAEWEIMKNHTTAGYNLLKSGNGDITNLAAIIANEHHERWDGAGYPSGKAAEDIHLFARITSIADVFDALLSARCYKEPWPIEKVVSLFIEEQGKQFDPHLTQLLLTNLDDFVEIRNTYPDTSFS